MIVGSLFSRGAHHAETKITEIYFVKKGLQVKDALFSLILRKTGGAITKAIIGHYSGLYGVFFCSLLFEGIFTSLFKDKKL